MSNFIICLGASGSGKSTSIKSLDPKETVVINVLGKRLPFKGSNSAYNSENKNMFKTSSWINVIKLLTKIDKSLPHVQNIIIDK